MSSRLRFRRLQRAGTLLLCLLALAGSSPADEGPISYRLSGLPVQQIATVLEGEPGGQIAIEVLALPRGGPVEGGEVPTEIWVEVDGSSFLDHNRSARPRVEMVAYALEGDRPVRHLAVAFSVDIERHGEAIWQGGLKIGEVMSLPPGDYRIRVLVRNADSDAAGLQEVAVRIPEGQVPPTPVLAEPSTRESWLRVRGSAGSDSDLGPRLGPPSVLPILRAGRELEARLPGGDASFQDRCRVVLERPRAQTVHVACTATESDAGPRVAFALPSNLDAGPALLRVELGSRRSAQTRVFVADRTVRAVDLLWTDVRWQTRSTPRRAAVAPAPGSAPAGEGSLEEDSREVQAVAARYRDALARLAEGPMVARIAVEQMESQALGPGSRKRVEALIAAQRSVTEEIAARRPEALLAIWQVHLQLYEGYRSRQIHALVSHSRVRLEEIAELSAGAGDARRGRQRAADMMVVLGGRLQRANLPTSSERLFRRALEYDAEHPVALLGLATSFEKYGEYGQAIRALRDLVAHHPEHAEGRLRHGINLRRLGDRSGAVAAWERVLDLEAAPWIRALALQEIARERLATGDRRGAIGAIERALEEAPTQVSSVFLLAHLYDLERRTAESFEALRRADLDSGEASARLRYDQWPEEPYLEVERRLEILAAETDQISSGGAGSPGETAPRAALSRNAVSRAVPTSEAPSKAAAPGAR